MEIFKSKSLTSSFTDEQIKDKCGVTWFISYESAIKMMEEAHNINDEKIGYRCTEQGIVIIYK